MNMNRNNKPTSGHETKRSVKSRTSKEMTTIRSYSDEGPSSSFSKKVVTNHKPKPGQTVSSSPSSGNLSKSKDTKTSAPRTRRFSKTLVPVQIKSISRDAGKRSLIGLEGESDTEKIVKVPTTLKRPSTNRVPSSQLSSEASPEASKTKVSHEVKSVSLAPTRDLLQTRRKKFLEFAQKCQRITIEELQKEFQQLPGHPHDEECAAFFHPANSRKNRYLDIRCLESSRVRLSFMTGNIEGADYIHANYIKSKYLPHRCILTQGPRKNTISDFWRMVWQEGTTVIVMLCDFFELEKEKCAFYYPRFQGAVDRFENVHRDFQLIHESSSKERGVVTTKLKLEFKQEPPRQITHYQFLEWPDFNVPTSSKSILQILSRIRKEQTPTVIHCAAGIGRSGTFMAIEIAIRAFTEDVTAESPDIKQIVTNLRMSGRCGAVQTLDQYLLIRKILLEYAVANSWIPEEAYKRYNDLYLLAVGKKKQDPKIVYNA